MSHAPIPLYALSGFVGSGKTTALLGILKKYPEKKIGVIFTEPAAYIKESDDISIECLDNGSLQCICEEEALPQALQFMSDCQPELVLVEISGLSDPLRIEQMLDREQNSACMVAYDKKGIICLVDADNFMEQIGDVEMVKHQLSHCHLAVINKADLVAPELLTVLKAQIRRINPDCEISSCSYGGFGLELLDYDLMSHTTQPLDSTGSALNPDSIVLNCPCRMERQKVVEFISRFLDRTYRIKGFCLLEDGWNQIDVVGSKITLSPCVPHSSSRLIFISKIGHALSEPLRQSWEELVGLPMQLHD